MRSLSSKNTRTSFPLIVFILLLSSSYVKAQLTHGFGPITCKPGEYDFDDEYEDTGGVESGWGNCHHPSVGLAGATKKFCFKSVIGFENGTQVVDWRCSCSTSWPLEGDACDEPSSIFFWIQFGYILPAIINWIEFWRGQKVVRTMLRFAKWKVNAANLSAFFMCLLTWSESMRFLTWSVRGWPGSYDDELFRGLQVFVPISAVAVSEGLIGLALAWLDIAVKSSAMGKGKKATYSKRRKTLKVLMYGFMFINIYLFAIGRATMIAAVGLFMLCVITPTLYIGGRSLRELLSRCGEPPPPKGAIAGKDLKSLIWTTSVFVVFNTPIFIITALIMLVSRIDTKKTGINSNASFLIGSVLMFIWSMTMTGTAHMLLTFFDETNKRKMEKMRLSKMGGAKQFVNGLSSMWKSTKGKSKTGRSSKSRATTKNGTGTSSDGTNASSNVSSTGAASSTASSSSSSSKSSGWFGSSKNSSSVLPESEMSEMESDFDGGSSFVSLSSEVDLGGGLEEGSTVDVDTTPQFAEEEVG